MHAFVLAALASLAFALPAQDHAEITMMARAPAATTSAQCSTATKAPSKKLQCGPTGTLTNPAILSTTKHVKSMDVCVSSCLANNACKSLAYDSTKKTCYLYSKTAEQMGFMIGEPGLHYYDTKCFTVTCPPTTTTSSGCAATTSANLVTNGGFESGSFSPGFSQPFTLDATASVAAGGAYGKSQYKFVGNLTTTSAPSVVNLQNTFGICPVGSYTFSIDYQFSRLNSNDQIVVNIYNAGSDTTPVANLANIVSNNQAAVGQWATHTSTFQWDNSNSADLSVSVQNGKPDGGLDLIYLDNIIVKSS